MGHPVVGWEVGILGVQRAADGAGNHAAYGSVSVRDGCAFFCAALQEGLEMMKVRLRDLQATAAIALLMVSGNIQTAGAQAATATAAVGNLPAAPAASNQAPEVKLTEPLYLRDTGRDYTRLKPMFPNPIGPYTRTGVELPRLGNTPRLDSLVRDGKIYLSLSDAVVLALENNFDIAIARINLDIADTDILRTKAGAESRPGWWKIPLAGRGPR